MFRNPNDLCFGEPNKIQELRHEIFVWQRAAASLSSYSKDEDLVRETIVKKVNRLQRELKKKLTSGPVPVENYKQTLQDLQKKVRKANKHIPQSNEVFKLMICLFSFSVSNQKPHSIDQINSSIDIYREFLLSTLIATHSKIVSRLDSSAWCHFTAHFSRSRGFGCDFSSS